jgi:Ca2+-transporting ATPase
MTMAFLTMSLIEIFHAFNMRSQRNSVFRSGKSNKWLWGSLVLSLILTTGVIYVPFLAEAFAFSEISLTEFTVAVMLAAAVIPIVEIIKFMQRKTKKTVDNRERE